MESHSDDEAFRYAVQLSTFTVLPMTLKAAIELNLLEIIVEAGPGVCLSPSEIVARLPTTNPKASETVDRMLRLLACYNVITCDSSMTDASGRVERRYGANNVTKYLSKDEDGASLAAYAIGFSGRTFLESWHYLKNTVLDGGNGFTLAHGVSPYEYAVDPEFNTIINEGMKNYSCIVMKKVLEVYKAFDDLHVLVDIGGGTGKTLSMIITKYPHIKGINFDLPHVISEAPPFPGIEHVGGSLLENVPSGDAILLKSTLCGWDDEHSLQLLKKIWKALPDNGKVIIIDGILPTTREEKPNTSIEKCTLNLDLLLVLTSIGKVRTEEEFENLAKVAGFSRFKRVCDCFDVSVMEFYK